MTSWGQTNSTWNDPEANKLPEKVEEMKLNGEMKQNGDTLNEEVKSSRKRVVIVGLGMVGISFMYVQLQKIAY
jgi:nitrite reductase (NAD(P)H)